MATENKLVKIRLNHSVAGTDFDGNGYSFAAGEEVEVESRLAADLCRGENADLVLDTKKENTISKHKPETR